MDYLDLSAGYADRHIPLRCVALPVVKGAAEQIGGFRGRALSRCRRNQQHKNHQNSLHLGAPELIDEKTAYA
jgi:hypothetical protein